MSTRARNERIELLQGTLDLLILRTLFLGPMHGHAIAKAIEYQSNEVLLVEQGSLYPALHRLIKRRWISVEEGISENNRRAKFYRLTAKGRQQLTVETNKWDKLAAAIGRILRPARAGGRIMKSRKRMLRELEEDIRDYLERETQDNMERGMSPDEARHAALRKFGNVAQVREETWEVWSVVWLEQLLQDTRFGMRMLWRSPGNTIASVLAIALGIGINVGIFSVLNGAALRLLPIPRPEQVVSVSPIFHGHFARNVHGEGSMFSYPEYLNYRDHNHVFTGLVAYEPFVDATLAGGNVQQLSGTTGELQLFRSFGRATGSRARLCRFRLCHSR